MPQTGVWQAHGTEIEELIRQDTGMTEIARRFGVSRERISKALRQKEP